jgi:RNA methyltransferase, TrmH family
MGRWSPGASCVPDPRPGPPVLSRAEEKLLLSLGRRRRRAAEGLFMAEGVRVVEELLDAGHAPRLALVAPSLTDTPRGQALAGRLEGAGATRQVSDPELGRLAGTRSPQGVLVVAPIPRAELSGQRPDDRLTALVLDGVQDPGNIGTLARAAVAFGCRLLVCLPGTVDPWNPKAVRASAGALLRLAVAEPEPDGLQAWVRRHDITLLGADAAGEPVTDMDRTGRVALVVGNEGAGLTDEVRARCDRLVAVPMAGPAESLNVAMAAGILLYELTREQG